MSFKVIDLFPKMALFLFFSPALIYPWQWLEKESKFGVIVESAEPREPHHFSMLFGYGASAMTYLVNEVIDHHYNSGHLNNVSIDSTISF